MKKTGKDRFQLTGPDMGEPAVGSTAKSGSGQTPKAVKEFSPVKRSNLGKGAEVKVNPKANRVMGKLPKQPLP